MRVRCSAVPARKSVKQRFNPDEQILRLMETFRRMVNECIRVGLAEKRSSLKSLSLVCYPKLKSYETPSVYKLCAISKAAGILKHYRKFSKKHRVREPYCTRLSLTTCYGVKVIGGRLRAPAGIEIPLNQYTLRFLLQPNIEVRSVTLTPDTLSISVRKHVKPMQCAGMLSIDANLNNLTIADTENQTEKYDLSRVTTIKARCREVKRRFRRNDVKARRRICGKYGRLERNRVGWLMNNVSEHCSKRKDAKAGGRHGGFEGYTEALQERKWTRPLLPFENELLVVRSCNAKSSTRLTGMAYR